MLKKKMLLNWHG